MAVPERSLVQSPPQIPIERAVSDGFGEVLDANRRGQLGVFVAAELLELHDRRFDVDVEAVEQRAGDAVSVVFHLAQRTAALAFWIPEITA